MGSPAGSSFRQLQAHLGHARARFKAGEFEAALESVDCALELDPQYLAARALRDKIAAARLAPLGGVREIETPELQAPVSIESFAKFEQRARHRRAEHRLHGARQAIQTGQLGEARAAIDELSTLDPDLPDLGAITLELSRAEQTARVIPSRGPWFAAGVALTVALLAATWYEIDSLAAQRWRRPIPSSPAVAGHAGLIDPLAPVGLDIPAPDVTLKRGDSRIDDVAERATVPPPITNTGPATVPLALIDAPVLPPPPSDPPATAPPVLPLQPTDIGQLSIAAIGFNDDRLVRDTLQRYQSAYDRLNAKSAQDIWPTVDEAALARAFDGLESQRLTFDDCSVQLRGARATATCRGSARYTPREGTREPHVEPRVWNFTLSKTAADWQIDSARVGR